MTNAFELPISAPDVPINNLDEKKEEDKMLLQGLRELIEAEEDPVAQYALIEKIVDLEEKEYFEEDSINIQNETTSALIEQTEDGNLKKDNVWEDIGNHTGLTNKKFPHPTKSTKTPEEKALAKKIAIEKALKKRRERDGHIGYINPLDQSCEDILKTPYF